MSSLCKILCRIFHWAVHEMLSYAPSMHHIWLGPVWGYTSPYINFGTNHAGSTFKPPPDLKTQIFFYWIVCICDIICVIKGSHIVFLKPRDQFHTLLILYNIYGWGLKALPNKTGCNKTIMYEWKSSLKYEDANQNSAFKHDSALHHNLISLQFILQRNKSCLKGVKRQKKQHFYIRSDVRSRTQLGCSEEEGRWRRPEATFLPALHFLCLRSSMCQPACVCVCLCLWACASMLGGQE